MRNRGARPVKVVVLGGGVSGLAAAFELSDPRHSGRFEVSLYQLGWRLGGKCASGRDLGMPQGRPKRIKEHGPHILFGFYDNAFAVLREAYQSLPPDPNRAFTTVEDAMVAQNALVAMEQLSNGKWDPWVITLPDLPGRAGDPMPDSEWRTLNTLVEKLENSVIELRKSTNLSIDLDALLLAAKQARLMLDTRLRAGSSKAMIIPLSSAQALLHAAELVVLSFGTAARRLFILIDLGLAIAIGALRDDLFWPTSSSVAEANEKDYRDWLRSHGAADITVKSAVVRAMYDTVFAYPDGDVREPGNVEAGSAVLTQKGLISYRGPPCWKMRAGTGDVTVAPLYQALVNRGVQVHFFHRVDKLISDASGAIDRIRIGIQATLNQPPYRPLVTVKGVASWPDRPLYDQLVQGRELEAQKVDLESFWTPWTDPVAPIELLQAAGDFDEVVLAIPVGGLRRIAPEPPLPAWQQMLDAGKTVATASVQLWLNKSTRESGFTAAPAPVLTAFDRTNLDTWLDASEVIAFEDWPTPEPRQMAILCGPMQLESPASTSHDFPSIAAAKVSSAGQDFLTGSAALWPNLHGSAGFDWSALVAKDGRVGTQRFSDQYWVAGVNPYDRYVLTPAGSSKSRLAPNGSGYTNLFLCGDWTDYGYNLGCFEGAIISGLLAANAITSDPRPIIRDPFAAS